MELDFVLITDEKSATNSETRSEEDKSLYHTWDKSNRLSLSLMKITLAENVKPSMPKTKDAKEFM